MFRSDDLSPPPSECVVGDPLCTEHPVAGLRVLKSSDPVSGTAVNPGDIVTYTLLFDNRVGVISAQVAYSDDVSGVLDDATLVSGPSVSGVGVTVSLNGGVLVIAGTVGAGAVVTVTYQVKVNATLTGDGRLRNVLVRARDVPPADCVTTDPLCTDNPINPPNPTTTTVPSNRAATTTTLTNSGGGGGGLARSGTDVVSTVMIAIAALLIGVVLSMVGMRRRRQPNS
jgi:hypothetical protein